MSQATFRDRIDASYAVVPRPLCTFDGQSHTYLSFRFWMASSIVASARSACEQYVEWAPDDWSRREAKDMQDRGDETLLVARFGKRIAFGTAGLRAVMGAGTAAMNPLVILQTCQGLCRYGQVVIPLTLFAIGRSLAGHLRRLFQTSSLVELSSGLMGDTIRRWVRHS